MTETTDPTFYRTPNDAIAAAPEALAYVAAYDPKGVAKDAIAVLDCDATSATYGKPVG
jgi:methanethiol oxidase